MAGLMAQCVASMLGIGHESLDLHPSPTNIALFENLFGIAGWINLRQIM